ncbi:MAG: hypothetical protein H0Z24_03015 [Thermosipho sp. (in: Bacteria)]|nr:hypothetical protein [Thermosipho sp. (in: thermotogales)]
MEELRLFDVEDVNKEEGKNEGKAANEEGKKKEKTDPAKTETDKLFEPGKPVIVGYAGHQIVVPDDVVAKAKGKSEEEALEVIRKWLGKKFMELQDKKLVKMNYDAKKCMVIPVLGMGKKGSEKYE